MVDDHAYVLANHHYDSYPEYEDEIDCDSQMEVYVLDLNTWHWEQLPTQIHAPMSRKWAESALFQVSVYH